MQINNWSVTLAVRKKERPDPQNNKKPSKMKTLNRLDLAYETVTILLENKVRFKKEQMLKDHNFTLSSPNANLDALRQSTKEYEQAVDELEEHKGWANITGE